MVAVDHGIRPSFKIENMPSGAWYQDNHQQIVLGATTRSYVALFLIPFLLFWSSGVFSIEHFSDVASFDFFMVPFLMIGSMFWWFALMSVIGKVELTIDRDGGRIFTGIWKIGLYRNFKWQDIDFIQEETFNFVQYPGNQGARILMEGKRIYSFGSGLRTERRYWMIQTLKILYQRYKKHS